MTQMGYAAVSGLRWKRLGFRLFVSTADGVLETTGRLGLDPGHQGGELALPVSAGLAEDRLDLIPHRFP